MPKFMVVHPVGKELTLEIAAPIARAVKANLTVDAYWVKSIYVRGEGKLYCEWDAKDAESIQGVIKKAQEVLKKALPDFPTEGIYVLENEFMVSAESFR